jgi:hypothetical protein
MDWYLSACKLAGKLAGLHRPRLGNTRVLHVAESKARCGDVGRKYLWPS